MHSVDLSIIILNYNTKDITLDAISSLEKNYAQEVQSGRFEVIVVDNASSDGSAQAFKQHKQTTKIKTYHGVVSDTNSGFSAGNNKGVPLAKGKYVLFLNSDTIVYPKTLTYLIDFMENHPDVGAASCYLENRDGAMDFNCHRGFPTPWNAFCYFSGLQRLFPKSRLFSGYTQGWKDMSTNHEVDAIEGAFMMLPRWVGEKIGWWDEDYFFYGEDLQFCFDIKKLGLKIYYLGKVKIMHIGGAASGIKKSAAAVTTADVARKRNVQVARFRAMKLFYQKNYKRAYPWFVRKAIYAGVDLLEKRALRALKW